ncbi:MAG: hypothetical protein KDN05_22715, partial [Verrucomicrobiae bacterium]|nr:hypothetical protein [Verrucomicrobiae bacterium]
MTSILRGAAFAAIVFGLQAVSAVAAEKVYEKPSAFLTRHFGKVPQTRVLKIDGARQKQLAA